MADHRLAKPKTLFGWVFWLVLGVGIFTWLYFVSGPPAYVAHRMAAAGPDGVTAFFESPEASVVRINDLLASRDWMHLARYYDFSTSSVTRADIVSGTYFAGDAALPERAVQRPFPPGYHFVYSEPSDLDNIYHVMVEGAPTDAKHPDNAPQVDYYLRAEPEGYRIIPNEAVERLRATAAKP